MEKEKQIKIIKRTGRIVNFDEKKIQEAILKAMYRGSGIVKPKIAKDISLKIKHAAANKKNIITVIQVEKLVYIELIKHNQIETAKCYEEFRAIQAFKRETNTTDESILSLLNYTNEDVMKENSNKNAILTSTQRDLIAGEISKDISRRKILPAHIVQAHDDCILHYHDMDYTIQKMFNCCLINIKDMLDNGTVINGKMVESPKSFQTACTILTQIIAQISSGQYGGQSINIKHLGKYLYKSHKKYIDLIENLISNEREKYLVIKQLLDNELKAGVQTIQYQINTLLTTNGQSPFVTIFLEIDKNDEYYKYTAMIIEEILKQRYQGIKNEKGVYITPSFPKLIYVLDEHNAYKDSEFYFITKLAAKCSSKRLYPDYISAKKMKEIYEGNVFSPMGQQIVA